MSHKHAEALRAIAMGNEVQWKSLLTGEWQDVHPQAKLNPINDAHLEWRAKTNPVFVYWDNTAYNGFLYVDINDLLKDQDGYHDDEVEIGRAYVTTSIMIQIIKQADGNFDWIEV